MIKHVGKHGEKRVAVVFREVPGEDHMALVTYPDSLKQQTHDDLMNAIQSVKGQEANHLGEALHSIVGADGQTLLNTLHREGFMKKVRTQDIIMMPRPNQPGARLDEINKIIRDLETGSEAAQKAADLDANAGLADPQKKAAGVKAAAQAAGVQTQGVLGDADIARNLVAQAEQMQAQMETLQAEAARLMEEAATLDPSLKPKKRGRKPTAKKATA
tara:strand:- start:564 stop:1211 length:648 start_codon:yes stop_codon:yes gene_type:complete